MNIKIFGGEFHLYSPRKKHGIECVIGFKWYKDWRHVFEWTIRFSLFERPHMTRCKAYTLNKKNAYITDFVTFASRSFREYNYMGTAFRHDRYISNINDGRDCS